MSPFSKWTATLGVLSMLLGVGLIGYFIGDHFATRSVADEQCPLYTDYSKPFCQGLLNRLNSDWLFLYVGDGFFVIGWGLVLFVLSKERQRSVVPPPIVSNPESR